MNEIGGGLIISDVNCEIRLVNKFMMVLISTLFVINIFLITQKSVKLDHSGLLVFSPHCLRL